MTSILLKQQLTWLKLDILCSQHFILAVLLLALEAGVYQFMKQEAGWQGERKDPNEYVHPANLDELAHPYWQGSNKKEAMAYAQGEALAAAERLDEQLRNAKDGDTIAVPSGMMFGLGLPPGNIKPFDEEEFLHRHEKIKKDIAKIELPGEKTDEV